MRGLAVVGGRFELIELLGSGGMGVVHRAIDKSNGSVVALKLMHEVTSESIPRFAHEARALGELRHPHIVEYITHGEAETGEPYLVMEWLEGQSLADKLTREGLRIEESVDLARRVASALAKAHALGIVHRDIKPSNIFLVNGLTAGVKVLDFGIARLSRATAPITRTGSILGTPGYMAPEQARGERAGLDSRVDVFSLGCVLFECLTGKPAFHGTHIMALLAKLLLEEPPHARELAPHVPEDLDNLVARMLSKDPADRPSDGAAVLEALNHLGSLEGVSASQRARAPESLTNTEKRLVSVIALAPSRAAGSVTPNATTVSALPLDLVSDVRRIVKPFGGKVEEILSGILVVLLVGVGPITDQALMAARCALALSASTPTSRIVLLTGRGESSERLPVGPILESAAALLEAAQSLPQEPESARPQIDEVTRSLLEGRFEIYRHNDRMYLGEERDVAESARMLLGKPTPFVGREREVRHIAELIDESFEEPHARAILVTGDSGIGKSRLRYEVMRRLRETHPDAVISLGRGDSMGAGSAFALLASAFRGSLGIATGAPIDAQKRRLSAVVETFIPTSDGARVTAFLGELIGARFPDDDEPKLRAARHNPAIMADQIQAAYLDFVRAAAASRPIALVLEDLHWGDLPSLTLVDAVLRDLPDRPFVVLAFGRREVRKVFPALWTGRDVQEIVLSRLSRRASEALARSALDDAVTPAQLATIIDRAAGNAFFLEELIRVVAEGRGDELPVSILGMVEARIAALDPDARRYLRAASVFGDSFWEEGLYALLGADRGSGGPKILSDLCERELILRRASSRLAGQSEYAFRHALVREAAYAMLTDRDRALGHGLAGDWLESAGEQDAIVLAEHFERSPTRARAAAFYARAAAHAVQGADLPAALAGAEKGLACGAEGLVKVALHTCIATACFFLADYARCYESSVLALSVDVPSGTSEDPNRAVALGFAIIAATFLGRLDALAELAPRMLTIDPGPQGASAFAQALYGVFVTFIILGRLTEAAAYLRRMEELAAEHGARYPVVEAWTQFAKMFSAREIDGDLSSALHFNRASSRCFSAAGARGSLETVLMHEGLSLAQLGSYEEALRIWDRILAAAGTNKLALMYTSYFKSVALFELRRLDEARALTSALARDAEARRDRLMLANARLLLIQLDLQADRTDDAERALLAFGEEGAFLPYLRARFLSLLSEIRRRQGSPEEAADLAARSIELGRAGPRYTYGEDPLLLRRAEALLAAGRVDEAQRVIRAAKDDLLASGARITDDAMRHAFYRRIPDHARALALAESQPET